MNVNNYIDSIINSLIFSDYPEAYKVKISNKDNFNDFQAALENQTKRNKINAFARSIKKVIFNDPAVIVIWKDGTKTSVVCQEGETFDKEKGLALAIIKHQFGDIGYYNTIFKEWLDKGIDCNK